MPDLLRLLTGGMQASPAPLGSPIMAARFSRFHYGVRFDLLLERKEEKYPAGDSSLSKGFVEASGEVRL